MYVVVSFITGQCFDAHSDSPTPGLEIVMGSRRDPNRFDTIVMANLVRIGMWDQYSLHGVLFDELSFFLLSFW